MEVSKNTVAALLVLVLVVSVISTWVVLDKTSTAEPQTVGKAGNTVAGAKIVLEKNSQPISESGKIRMVIG